MVLISEISGIGTSLGKTSCAFGIREQRNRFYICNKHGVIGYPQKNN